MKSDRAKRSRKQLAYEVLRDRILSLELESNSAIVENEIALELGISRTPVREALAALEREGLVRILRGKGAFVAPTSAQRVVEAYEVREVLEGLAASLASGRISSAEFRPLREIFQGYLDGKVADVRVLTTAADQVHQLIAERCGNSHVQHLLRQMSDQVRRLRAVSANRTARMTESTREHLEIMQAIENNEPQLAETLMRHHIRAVRASLSGLLVQPVVRRSEILADV